MNYTDDQKKDILERQAKALEMLKELELNPAAQLSYNNMGEDNFVTKVQPYLQDTKFLVKKSSKRKIR